MPDGAVMRARELFPSGLIQPPGSFRFAADALLLAAFALETAAALPSGAQRLLELGCGCGAASFASLLQLPALRAVGADIQPALADAANANARALGLEERFRALALDLALPDAARSARQGLPPDAGPAAFDLVMANPPYRRTGEGRLPPSDARRIALFADENTLPAFLGTARAALAPDGRLLLIYPAEQLAALLAALGKYGLSPLRVLPVASRRGMAPLRALVSALPARRGGRPAHSVSFDPPLVLLRDGGGKTYTPNALAFCPYLAR